MTAPETLVRYNTFIALLILLAHGGGLVAGYISNSPDADAFLPFALVSCTLAIVLTVSGVLALLKRVSIQKVLKQHAIILVAAAVVFLGWAAFVAITGLPSGRFRLNPILFVVVVAYPFYLLRQTLLFDYIDYWYVDKIHLIIGVVAGIVSVALMYKMFEDF